MRRSTPLLRGCDGTSTCSVDATAHCMHTEDCVGWTEDCQASEVREDCKDARSWGACWFARQTLSCVRRSRATFARNEQTRLGGAKTSILRVVSTASPLSISSLEACATFHSTDDRARPGCQTFAAERCKLLLITSTQISSIHPQSCSIHAAAPLMCLLPAGSHSCSLHATAHTAAHATAHPCSTDATAHATAHFMHLLH